MYKTSITMMRIAMNAITARAIVAHLYAVAVDTQSELSTSGDEPASTRIS